MSKEEIAERAGLTLDAWEQGEPIDEISFADDIRNLIAFAIANKATEEGDPNDAELAKEVLLEDLESIADYWTGTVVEVYGGKSVNVGNDLREKFAKLKLTAIANTATEEGELPYGWAYECVQPGTDGKGWSEFFSRYEPKSERGVRNITPLFSRQVANKAEVEPVGVIVADDPVHGWHMHALKPWNEIGAGTKLCATPPATTGASTAELKALQSRVSELEAARIAYASEFPLTEDGDPDVGNIHANIRALKGLVGASTVLTDERIEAIWCREAGQAEAGKRRIAFARAIEREVAAQAGQVAVPEGFVLVPVEPTPEMIAAIHFKGDLDIAIGHGQFYKDAEEDYAAMLAAAPSPAKESK